MNKLIRNKIIKNNLHYLLIGIVCIVGGISLSILFFLGGYTGGIFVVPFIGVGVIIYWIYRMIFGPSNMIYNNWKFYGGNDAIVEEITDAIKSKKKEFESDDLVISNGWIIQPKQFLFAKLKDVNWIHFSGLWMVSSNNYKVAIKIHTIFGVEFEVMSYSNKLLIEKIIGPQTFDIKDGHSVTTQELKDYLNLLSRNCKNAILGHNPEYFKIYSESPELFVKHIKEYNIKKK